MKIFNKSCFKTKYAGKRTENFDKIFLICDTYCTLLEKKLLIDLFFV